MKSATIFFVVATITVCVKSQAASPANLPPAAIAALQTLQADIKTMHTSDTWDSKKIGADLQAIGTAIKANVDSAAPAIQEDFKKLQAQTQTLIAGTSDKEVIKQTMMSSMKLLEALFPGTKKFMFPEGQKNDGNGAPAKSN